MPSKLLVRPTQSPDGVRHRITPESAGWTYVGFEFRVIDKGARASLKTGEREICIVVLSGRPRVGGGRFRFRPSANAPTCSRVAWSVYLPGQRGAVEARRIP